MTNNSGNGPAYPSWLRPAIFVGGAAVLLGVGYFIGATFFANPQTTPVAEAPVELTRTLVPTFTPSPVPPTATNTVLPTSTLPPVPTEAPPSATPILVVVTAAASPTTPPTNTPPPPTATAASGSNDQSNPTSTPTWTPTLLATATWTLVPTATWTPISTATWTPVPTATATFLPTATATATLLPTATETATLTPTATATVTPTATSTATLLPTATATATMTPTATATATAMPTATETSLPTMTATATPTATESATPSPTETVTATPTEIASETATATEAPTATATAEPTATEAATASATPTPAPTDEATPTGTMTATATSTATATKMPTATKTPTATPTATAVPTAVWDFAGEPPLGAFLNQPYTYTVTFAPLAAEGAPEEEGATGEEATGDTTPEAPPSEGKITPPETDEGVDTEAATDESTVESATEESPESTTDTADEGATDVSGATAADGEVAVAQLVESLPFAVTADGALTVEVTVRPLWLALTTLDSGEVALVGTPGAEDEGDHPVEVTAIDAAGVVITQSFTITAELDPDPFRLDVLAFTTEEDTPLEGVLTAEHIESADLFYGVESEPENGTITAIDEATGVFTYAPLPDFNGDDVFTIRISDALAREVTAPVTITVEAVNDPPLIDMADTYTVTVGDVVDLPVIVTDVDSEQLTITVEALPPDLNYADGTITGAVAETAVEGSPYLAIVSADDGQGDMTTYEFAWIVEPKATEDEPGDDDSNVSSEAGEGGEAPVDSDEESTPVSEQGAGEFASITLAAAGALSVPGLDAWAGYGWQVPTDFGDCPANVDARTPAPLDAAIDLFADNIAADPAGAPRLSFAADLPAGEYSLLVCACAPAYNDGERASPAADNQALFAGIDGVVYLDAAGLPAPVTGFAEMPGFTWQALPAAAPGGSPALLTVPEAGARSVDLWMADDGVLVSGVQVVPAAALADVAAMLGQTCSAGE